VLFRSMMYGVSRVRKFSKEIARHARRTGIV